MLACEVLLAAGTAFARCSRRLPPARTSPLPRWSCVQRHAELPDSNVVADGPLQALAAAGCTVRRGGRDRCRHGGRASGPDQAGARQLCVGSHISGGARVGPPRRHRGPHSTRTSCRPSSDACPRGPRLPLDRRGHGHRPAWRALVGGASPTPRAAHDQARSALRPECGRCRSTSAGETRRSPPRWHPVPAARGGGPAQRRRTARGGAGRVLQGSRRARSAFARAGCHGVARAEASPVTRLPGRQRATADPGVVRPAGGARPPPQTSVIHTRAARSPASSARRQPRVARPGRCFDGLDQPRCALGRGRGRRVHDRAQRPCPPQDQPLGLS
jgi:hypothetical protein